MQLSKHLPLLSVSLVAGFVIAGVLVAEYFKPLGAMPSPPINPEQALINRLQQETDGLLRVSYHAKTSFVRFIGTNKDRPILRSAGVSADSQPEQAARFFLGTYGALFGLNDQEQQLAAMRISQAAQGRSFVRFQQLHYGLPILGSELIVQLDNAKNVLSVNGEMLPNPRIEIVPGVAAESARGKALAAVGAEYGLRTDALIASEPELWIYNPLILGAPGPQITQLVWRVDIVPVESLPIRELVLVDAQLGVITLRFNQVAQAKYRKIYDNLNNRSLRLPGNGPVREENQPPIGTTDVDNAYDFIGDTYDFYKLYHGRDSLDGMGMPLVATVRYCRANTSTDTYPCPYPNAFWNGLQLVFGQGWGSADDVVAHETTHGVTDKESHLFYYMQSGAIHEAFSDIWGEFIDLTNGKGNDAAPVRWLTGEDLPSGALRSMQDPPNPPNPCFSQFVDNPPGCNERQPDRITSSYYFCGERWEDNGGVHLNSGVANKAAYLMTDGGAFNGRVISGLGIPKVAKIFYEVQTNLLTSAGDYQDLYDTLQQACANLVGISGIAAGDCQQVKNAVEATEMNLQPSSCKATHAPACAGGQMAANLFFDNLENPSSGNWVSGRNSGASVWYYPQNSHPFSGWDATYATSGVYNLWGCDLDIASDSFIRMTSDVALPAGNTAYLHFNHAYSFEVGSSGSAFDGGVVEYSTNGGSSWQDAEALFDINGYSGMLRAGTSNPLNGRRAYVGKSNGYLSSRLNLGMLAGQSVRFRFRIGTDNSNGDYGWFIDDIRIYTCQTCTPGTPAGSLDVPANNASLSGLVPIGGWAAVVSGNAAGLACHIDLVVDGISAGPLTSGISRLDVQRYYQGRGISAPENLGYSGSWNSRTVGDGRHRLCVRVSDVSGTSLETVADIGCIDISSSNGLSPTTTATSTTTSTTYITGQPRGAVDQPPNNSRLSDNVPISGWAVVVSGNVGGLARRIDLYVDGAYSIQLDNRMVRPDVQQYLAGLGIAAPANLGFLGYWNSRTVPDGRHILSFRVADAAAVSQEAVVEIAQVSVITDNGIAPPTTTTTSTLRATSTVTSTTTTTFAAITTTTASLPTTTIQVLRGTPLGKLESPADNAIISGFITLSGWAAVVSGNKAGLADRIDLLVDDSFWPQLTPGVRRLDVQQEFAGLGITAPDNLGFIGIWDSRTVADGRHRLSIRVADVDGNNLEAITEIARVEIITNNQSVPSTTTTTRTTTTTFTTTTRPPISTSTTTATTSTTTTLAPSPQCNLFVDDFNDGNYDGWKAEYATWEVINGKLQVSQVNPAVTAQATHDLPVAQAFRVTMDVEADGFGGSGSQFYGFVTWGSGQMFTYLGRTIYGAGAAVLPRGLVGFLSYDAYEGYYVIDYPTPQYYESIRNIGVEWSSTALKLLVNGSVQQTIPARIEGLALNRLWLSVRGPAETRVRYDNICQSSVSTSATVAETSKSLRNLRDILRQAPPGRARRISYDLLKR